MITKSIFAIASHRFKMMGLKEEPLNERSMKMKDIVRKHKRELQKVQRSGNLELSKKLEADLMQWAMDNGEVNTDDPDDFIDWLDRDLDDIMKGKIKESINESNWGFVFYNKKSLDNFLKDPYIKSVTKNVTIDKAKFRGGKSGFSVGIESDEDLGLNPLAKKVEKIKKKYGKPGVDYAHVEHDGESISEGTWALPKTSKQKKELKDSLPLRKKWKSLDQKQHHKKELANLHLGTKK